MLTITNRIMNKQLAESAEGRKDRSTEVETMLMKL